MPKLKEENLDNSPFSFSGYLEGKQNVSMEDFPSTPGTHLPKDKARNQIDPQSAHQQPTTVYDRSHIERGSQHQKLPRNYVTMVWNKYQKEQFDRNTSIYNPSTNRNETDRTNKNSTT